MNSDLHPYPAIRSYVLRQSRATAAQERAIQELGPQFCVPYREVLPDWQVIFGRAAPCVLEVGFGMGHATAQIAKAKPDTDFICVEVHRPGIGALLARIESLGITNIRIVQHDVVAVMRSMIPPDYLSGCHVFFPDPWQKKRHHKRRLVQVPFLAELYRISRPDAYLYLASDWEDYAVWMLDELRKSGLWQIDGDDFCKPVAWRPSTSFEHKGLAKAHIIREIMAKKQP